MIPKPHIIVAGLARCGTSLTMQMLHAAGVSCIGDFPGFESPELSHRAVDPSFLARYPGHALKLLDPHLVRWPRQVPGIAIWLDRDSIEQARSQAKLVHLLMGRPSASRHDIRRIAASLRRERPLALAILSGMPTLHLSFERLLGNSREAAGLIADHIAPAWPGLDIEAMARVVKARSPLCARGLEIELSLVESLAP